MAMRIPWDKYETAILINACIQIINNKTDRSTAIQTVSVKLRKRAVNSGIMIDNVFRNENGVKMQMTMIMSIIQYDDTRTTMVLYTKQCTQNGAFAGAYVHYAEWDLIHIQS